jgi:serine/threonine-protein kinase RsbW
MVRLSVPGDLRYREVVLRVAASSCKLVNLESRVVQDASQGVNALNELESAVVSALGEAFNNIAIHGHADGDVKDVEIEIETGGGAVTIRMSDRGRSFDFPVHSPRPKELSESGMGLYIIQSFMDEVSYRPRTKTDEPNVLVMKKSLPIFV